MKHLLIGVIATLGLTAGASANLVTNGSFETFTGVFGTDGGAQLIPGATTLTGWTIVGGEIAILRSPDFYNLTASDGKDFLDLAGYSNTGLPKGLSQTLAGLTVGQNYALSFDVGTRNGPCVGGLDNCDGPVHVSASIGAKSQTFMQDSTALGNNWATFGFDFIATDTSMTLTIQGVTLPLGGEYIGLDNVSVVEAPVPEPQGLSMMLGGAGLVGWALRRRRATT